jgi:hypothetical protein
MGYWNNQIKGNGNDKITSQERLKGKVTAPIGGQIFKFDNILPKLPNRQPLDNGGIPDSKFQDLRHSVTKDGSI